MTMTMTVLILKTAPSGTWKKYMNSWTIQNILQLNNKSTKKAMLRCIKPLLGEAINMSALIMDLEGISDLQCVWILPRSHIVDIGRYQLSISTFGIFLLGCSLPVRPHPALRGMHACNAIALDLDLAEDSKHSMNVWYLYTEGCFFFLFFF